MSVRRIAPAGVALLVALLVALASTPAAAQGNLSTQGLGFSPGQLGTTAASMGGAIGESDPLSPLNPAAISLMQVPIIYMQAEPEFRWLTTGGRRERTSIARFPVFVGIMPMGSRWVVSASASTLLDRTWATTTRDTQFVGPDTLGADLLRRSNGSIADTRLAVSFAPRTWIRFGIGGHVFSGRALLQSIRAFDDSSAFVSDTQQVAVGFGGNAVSVGVQTLWPRVAAVGLSYRRGGRFRTYVEGEPDDKASAPDHFGASVAYLGLQGATLAVRASRDAWSRLSALSPSLRVHEGWDLGAGVDVVGPRFGGSPVAFRAGGRWRTLPFSATGNAVREKTWSGGLGLPLGGGRVELNVGALRATRTDNAGIVEDAWTISTGFAVRP